MELKSFDLWSVNPLQIFTELQSDNDAAVDSHY